MSGAKVRPGKDVVFGPTYLGSWLMFHCLLPFHTDSSRLQRTTPAVFIRPTYGDETDRGFYLRDGGYYFAISDKMDLKVLGEIYAKGFNRLSRQLQTIESVIAIVVRSW